MMLFSSKNLASERITLINSEYSSNVAKSFVLFSMKSKSFCVTPCVLFYRLNWGIIILKEIQLDLLAYLTLVVLPYVDPLRSYLSLMSLVVWNTLLMMTIQTTSSFIDRFMRILILCSPKNLMINVFLFCLTCSQQFFKMSFKWWNSERLTVFNVNYPSAV